MPTKSFLKRLLFSLPPLVITILVLLIFVVIFKKSFLSLEQFGYSFYTSRLWNPNQQSFGAFVFIIGTLLTSFLAVLISIPFSLGIALFINFYSMSKKIKGLLHVIIETLSGIPSIVYGFWGLYMLSPIIGKLALLFKQIPFGVGILTASLILSIMIIPLSTSIIIQLIKLSPKDLQEASYSLGATTFETIFHIVLPAIKPGLVSAYFISLGRALSETMAVTMLIGNINKLPINLFSPSNTLASVIANDFGEATDPLYLSSLVHLGLILFAITLFTSQLASKIYKKGI